MFSIIYKKKKKKFNHTVGPVVLLITGQTVVNHWFAALLLKHSAVDEVCVDVLVFTISVTWFLDLAAL